MAPHRRQSESLSASSMTKTRQSGYALALLLWMIAGMSLMVTAVIHFARDDISLAEVRIKEAKGRALAGGVAYLAVRDAALKALSPSGEAGGLTYGGDEGNVAATFDYQFDGIEARATIRPASAFVSLNSGSEEELFTMFVAVGGVEPSRAAAIMRGILDYRDQNAPVSREMSDFKGFRFREELLVTGGMTRQVYDRVKDFVHVHRTSGWDPTEAPTELDAMARVQKASSGSSGQKRSVSGRGLGGSAPVRQVEGAITFESLYRQKALALGRLGEAIGAVVVELSFEDGGRSKYHVWMSRSEEKLIRTEQLSTSVSG